MKTFKILMGAAAALALVALVAPPVHAQACNPSQQFRSVGSGMAGALQVQIDPTLAENAGNEIGRFWTVGDSNIHNNFLGGCPSTSVDPDDSWLTTLMNGNRGIQGFFGGDQGTVGLGGCCTAVSTCATCPPAGEQLALLVEEIGADPAEAVFFYGRVDNGNSAFAPWDFGRLGGGSEPTFPYIPFPETTITASNRMAGNVVDTTTAYIDVKPGVQAAVTAADSDLAASASVVSYDVCLFQGNADPGRQRALYSCTQSFPYSDGGLAGQPVAIDCDAAELAGQDIYVAVGLTFEGGDRDVPSELVGRSAQIECDPTHADAVPTLQRRDSIDNLRPKRSRDLRSGGRGR